MARAKGAPTLARGLAALLAARGGAARGLAVLLGPALQAGTPQPPASTTEAAKTDLAAK